LRADSKTKWIKNVDRKEGDAQKIGVPHVPAIACGYSPFSRLVEDVYEASHSSHPRNCDDKGNYRHYRPKGPRRKWTPAQYTVYKEEKRDWYIRAIKRANKQIKAAQKEMGELQMANKRWETLKIGAFNRHVLATIKGRKHGERRLQKDKKGMPIEGPQYGDNEGGGEASDAEQVANRHLGKYGGEPSRVRKMRLHQQLKADIAKAVEQDQWEVPSTDEEDDEIVKEAKAMRVPKYDEYGQAEVHDYWPSEWRQVIAEEVHMAKINLSVSLASPTKICE
jgi:hypothetical protein